MIDISKHIIYDSKSLKDAIVQLDNNLGKNVTLFVVDKNEKLIGSITDGDIRRGIVKKGLSLSESLSLAMNTSCSFLEKNNYSIEEIAKFRKKRIGLLPIVNQDKQITRIIEFDKRKSILPIDVVIIAGGIGSRLKPLTDNTPKPLLEVGGIPIIERNVRRLIEFGVENIYITVKYLGQQIIDYFKEYDSEGTKISFITETNPLGTFGSVTLINKFEHDHVLVMNSDLLTNINFEDMYRQFEMNSSALTVGSIPYKVEVPYAVMETKSSEIISLVEKPTYTYYSNAGIYLFKKEVLEKVPKNQQYNATDLIEMVISQKGKVTSYPILGYWLDIGKHEDYEKANKDVHHITF